MDFMTMLRSLEEALYEVVSWLLFYPVTLARALMRPVRTMIYGEAELADKAVDQYDDAVSPPIFLVLTLILAHLLTPLIVPQTAHPLPAALSDVRNLILLRAVLFSFFPLLLAMMRLRVKGERLARKQLKSAFYGQCYAAGPFILVVNVSLVFLETGQMLAAAIAAAVGLVWYCYVQARWLVATAAISAWPAVRTAVGWILGISVLFLAIVLAIAVDIRATS